MRNSDLGGIILKKVVLLILSFIFIFLTACGTNYENIYTDPVEPEVLAEGMSWPEGQVLPTMAQVSDELMAVDVTRTNSDVKTMMAGLQGIVNRKQPRLLVLNDGWKSQKWPEDMGLEYTIIDDHYEVIEKYKDEIKGLIVWDRKQRDTINLATSLAGLDDCLIVTEKLAETLTAEPYNFEIKHNLVGQFKDKYEVYDYMYENVWPRTTKRVIFGLSPAATGGHLAHLRDLAVAAKGIVLWLDPKLDTLYLDKFFDEIDPVDTYYCGWWTSEGDGIKYASEHGVPTIPSDYYENYTVYAGMSRELDIPTVPKKPELENKFYIAFAFSDGDNIQYVEHHMKDHRNMWPSKKRGEVPIAWTCSSALLDAGPQILNYYYRTATDNDMLVAGPSGLGYTDIQRWTSQDAGDEALAKYARLTDSYFRRTGFNFITIWNYALDSQAEIMAKNIPSLVGFSVQERFPGQADRSIMNGTTPFFTTHPRYDGDIPRVERIIAEQITAWNGSEPGFMIPQVIAWEAGVTDFVKMATNLKERFGDKVEFVRLDHLMMLYNEHMNVPFEVSLRANVEASGSDEGTEEATNNPENVVDGSFAKNKGWQSSNEGDKWITIDLGDEYSISRYTVQNAGQGYYDKSLNTKDFKIQASTDNESWKTIDTVRGNTSNIVDKYVDAFTARYVRLLITDPGEDGVARIQEFELFGNKVVE